MIIYCNPAILLVDLILSKFRIHNQGIRILYIYIYIYIYIYMYMVYSISFQTFFTWASKIVIDSWKFSMLLLYILWDDRPIFMISAFKWTATAAIGIHPTKAWLSQLVNFKSAIWHFRRIICYKILFQTWKNATETFGMLQTAFNHLLWIEHQFLSGIRDSRKAQSL